MTFRRLLPILIILVVLAGVGVLVFSSSDTHEGVELARVEEESDSDVDLMGYGEYSKDIIVDEVTEVIGDLAEYVSVVPGTYKLIYESKKMVSIIDKNL
jgi:hypothetical protein